MTASLASLASLASRTHAGAAGISASAHASCGTPTLGALDAAAVHECWDTATPRVEWVTQAKCRNGDPDALFVRGAEQRKAAAICQGCPVLMRCLADALDHRVEFGVWGGLTERQRRALLRKNPQVANWAEYLAAGGELVGI